MRNLERVSRAHQLLIDSRIYPTRATRECSSLMEHIIVTSQAWLAAGCQRLLPNDIDYFKTKFWLGWFRDDLLQLNAIPSNWFNNLSSTVLLT